MPGTVNGIGTTYLGQKNVRTEPGRCEHCGREGLLASYETRLWFTFLFVPLIPLRRKQILDYCSDCTWHKALPLGQWQEVERDVVRAAIERTERSPDDPEAAMELLGTLAGFGRREEAARYAEIMAESFPGHAGVQMQLGEWHEMEGRDVEADACYARARELDPENPAARRAVAVSRIQSGNLDEARRLLEFMIEPGGPSEPGVLLLLADAYHAQGRAEEAQAVYETVLQNHPGLAQNKQFRRRVQALETELGRSDTVLPSKPRRVGRWVVGGAIAAALLVGLFAWNGSLKSGQPLYVVNGLPQPVNVAVDAEPPFDVPAGGRKTLSLPEGPHRAVIRRSDGSEKSLDFTMENGFFERFGQDTAFVLNPDGAATLLWEEILYSVGPDPNHENPVKVHFAEEFTTFRDIDYAFEEPPPQLKTESKRLVKAVVRVLPIEPVDILPQMSVAASLDEAMRFGEHHLKLRPDDANLIDTYVYLAAGNDRLDRAVVFLEAGLGRRPVAVEWHRRYQEWKRRTGGEAAAVQRYDKMLADDPDNAALLYLRGRLELRSADAFEYYDRAIAADPSIAYPYTAKAFHLASAGELAAARELAATACKLDPENATVEELFFQVRFHGGEHQELEKELREAMLERPLDLTVHGRLLAVLVADGRAGEARAAHEAYCGRVRGELRDQAEPTITLAEAALAYLEGDLRGYLQIAEGLQEPVLANKIRFAAHLELGEPKEAEACFDAEAMEAGRNALLLSLAWNRSGHMEKAGRWRQEAIEILQSGPGEDRWLAGQLERSGPLDFSEVDEVALRREMKVALLAALAADYPDHRTALLDNARRLNAVSGFPHRFLGQVIEAMGQ